VALWFAWQQLHIYDLPLWGVLYFNGDIRERKDPGVWRVKQWKTLIMAEQSA